MWMPTNTNTTRSKSNLPNWLDKLRKVKGFPSVNDGHNLDNFLSQQTHHQQKPNDDDRRHPRDLLPENEDASTRMTNMLSDLFSDERSSFARSSNFKAPRKQPNPRICILPAAAVMDEDKGTNESDRVADAVVVDDRNSELKRKVGRGLRENEKVKEKRRKLGECDLVGFSRTEVTVIDSSNPLWKFDKYLYRKKNLWKARDCHVRFNYETKNCVGIGRKKKKEREGFFDDDEVVVSKKSKSFGARK